MSVPINSADSSMCVSVVEGTTRSLYVMRDRINAPLGIRRANHPVERLNPEVDNMSEVSIAGHIIGVAMYMHDFDYREQSEIFYSWPSNRSDHVYARLRIVEYFAACAQLGGGANYRTMAHA